ncbi:unnamed protein product [Parascedosporium putredinis]|uniref:Fork-head domain-containing protein n=1 Tax=Parascedosporium putredinis TaxID=1442378 RepID=A0A9P1H3T5_9PEZI|nr:unnamed protein product [Parascedosporium putredinis]CAI7995417.1 unnamed protein product [Parascedosporium putredinis]
MTSSAADPQADQHGLNLDLAALAELNPDPSTPLPAPDPGGGDTASQNPDVLPPENHIDADPVIADAPALAPAPAPASASASTPTPVEPITPVQHDQRPSLSRRGSTVEPNAIPFASASEASRMRNVISSNSFNMMAFAQMSSPHPMAMGHIAPPSIVTPSQVTLPIPGEGVDGMPGALYPLVSAEEGLESFARIEFADSVFQMTTYSVIIGRDQRAMDQAKRDERRAEEYRRVTEERLAMGLPPPSPIMQERNRKFSKSYVSEEGGMLGPESDGESATRPQKKRKRTRSTGSSQNDVEGQEEQQLIMDRQYVSHTPGAAAVDLKSLRPSPHHTPFIGIHSPGPDIASKTKAISREHLKIQFNAKKNAFEAIPLHKNGFFCDEVHYRQESVVLKSGARLQIKDVDFTFIINGVERGHTGAEDLDDGPKRSDELSDLVGSPPDLSDEGDLDGDSDGNEDDSLRGEQALEQPPKRRGPGRPPKDGIMSKRERREMNKREQEKERLRQLEEQAATGEIPAKRKVGRPRKHPVPESADGKPEKRKYKPRKPKGEDEGSEAERRRERKERRLARPKSPPLKLRREDFTEEQLAKPNKNYGILIDEVLREAGPDGLILKQIYNRISAKYPFYHFCTETKGWESSVRHNLIGNSAFRKDPKSGAWTRVPGIELDAGKKRKGDAAAVERAAAAAAAAASAAAAVAGGQPYATAYGNRVYPAISETPFGTQQGDANAQLYVPGAQLPVGADPLLQQGAATNSAPGTLGQQHGVAGSAAATAGAQAPQGQVQTAAMAHGQGHGLANGGQNYALVPGQVAPATPGQRPQANGLQGAAAAVPGGLATGTVPQGIYGTHAQSVNPAQGVPQQANGVGATLAGAPQAQIVRPSVLPRPALMHPQLITYIKKFAQDLCKHAELDRRWIFSAINRALALKPRHTPGPSKSMSLSEALERRLVTSRTAQTPTAAAGSEANPGQEKNKEQRQEKDREMGELMMLSCFDRLVGVMDRSVFDWIKEEGVSAAEEEELRKWTTAEAQLMPIVKEYVTKMGFTLPT